MIYTKKRINPIAPKLKALATIKLYFYNLKACRKRKTRRFRLLAFFFKCAMQRKKMPVSHKSRLVEKRRLPLRRQETAAMRDEARKKPEANNNSGFGIFIHLKF